MRRSDPTAPGGPDVIGWREWVSLPDLGIDAIKTKVDSGARTSCLHAVDVKIVTLGDRRRVRFKVHTFQRKTGRTVTAEADLLELRTVRSSSGHVTERPVIRTAIELKGQRWTIELTLASRDAMGFRMLLGRQALRGRFLIDPGRSYHGRRRRRR